MGREISGPEFVTNKTQHLASGLNGSTNYTCYIRLYSKVASDRSQQVTCKTGKWLIKYIFALFSPLFGM
jgi:hypothetical protein